MFVKNNLDIMNNQQFSPEMESFFDTPFPECEATKHFHLLPFILERYSPYGLQLKPEQFKELITCDGKFTYRLAGVVFNVMIAQTMKSLELTLDEYIQYCEDVTVSAKKWNDDIQAKHKEQAGMGQAELPTGKQVPFTPKADELKKAVKRPKAEA